MQKYIKAELEQTSQLLDAILADGSLISGVEAVVESAIKLYQNGGKILIAGNGGSASDAEHLVGELVGKFNYDRPALAAIALTANSATVTAVGNDYGYDHIFAREVEANGKKGDMFIGISTSGNSANIIKALEVAKKNSLTTVGLTGRDGGKMKALCNHCLIMPSDETPKIQEGHIVIGHIVCALIEQTLFPK